MSRSYKKNPVMRHSHGKTRKFFKTVSNRKFRREVNISDGGMFKKHFERMIICDQVSSFWTRKDIAHFKKVSRNKNIEYKIWGK